MKPGQLPCKPYHTSKEDRIEVLLERSLERKPDLQLKPNHRKQPRTAKRVWSKGTAYRDGNGWYRRTPLTRS